MPPPSGSVEVDPLLGTTLSTSVKRFSCLVGSSRFLPCLRSLEREDPGLLFLEAK